MRILVHTSFFRSFLAALAMLLGAWAQATATDLPRVLTDYTIASWGQKDGFPPGSTWAIAQDTDGYLWVGTDAGLYRFDGVRFVPWTGSSAPQSPGASVRALWVSRDGSLWAGYGETGGIVRIRNGASKLYGEPEGLPPNTVNAIVEDGAANLWAGTARGLFQLVDDRWVKSVAADLRDAPVFGAHIDAQGHLIVGAGAGIFRRRSDGQFERLATSQGGVPRSMSDDAEGRLYVTDSIAGFRIVGEASAAPADPLRRGRGYRLFHDRHDNLWVGTLGQGLWRLRAAATGESAIERTIELTGLSSNGVLALFEDRDGNLWVGTSEGLNRLVPRRITRITDFGLVTGVERTRDGDMWVGTVDELLRFSASQLESPLARVRLAGSPLRTMHADGDALWAATDRGIVRLVGRGVAPATVPGTETLRQVSAITTDSSGRLWLHDAAQGLLVLDGGRLQRFELPEARRTDPVMLMHTDSRDRVWLAFASGQLGSVTGRTLTLHSASSGFHPGTVHAMHEDTDGVLWLGRSDGLGRFSEGRFITLTAKSGFPLASVTAVAEDDARNLWVGSNFGIARINRGEFDKAAVSTSGYVIQYTLFDRSDGIAGTPQAFYSLGRPVARAGDGRLWYVTGSGVTIMDPQALSVVKPPAPVRIERVIADEAELSTALAASLPPRTSRLQIDYTVVNLTSPLRTNFKYRLDGFDADWVQAGTGRQAYYTNLPPRQYRFRVVASNSEGTPLSDTAWDFAIEPMFYQTVWFSAACAGGLALAGWGAWRLRLRQVRREFRLLLRERARLSREIHDTLLQSLVGVALQFDAVAGDLPPSAGASREQLVRMRKDVEEHIREARHSIWNLRSPTLRRQDLADALRDFAEQAASQHQIALDVAVNGAPRRRVPHVEEQLLRIGQEAITNSVRHGHPRRIRLQLDYRDEQISLTVADDGRGFDAGEAPREPTDHYGLISMRERAEEVGGTLHIATGSGSGTAITAMVPEAGRPLDSTDHVAV